ncbi:hypothetical protein B0H14DRAFT_2580232 [Mycena olivaceomarginata]|nr:hypothetical protein B0H14DRAFT_2580232 [Mycena olivaceomarginata]
MSPGGFHTKASKAEHYRTGLNNVAQQRGWSISYEATWTGPSHEPLWTAKVYLNNIEWGCGTGGSSGSAKEIAAKKLWWLSGFCRLRLDEPPNCLCSNKLSGSSPTT